ncbi:hypothetical protein ACP70R_027007 [Stipagrostis hirtigluma subsp. patula]
MASAKTSSSSSTTLSWLLTSAGASEAAASSILGSLAAADTDDPWPPAMEERYERLERVGQGVFGRVYRAWDRAEGLAVAVKHLTGRGGGLYVHTGVPDFAREAMSLRACQGHPAVVELRATFADHRRSDGDSFLVMELVGTMNLRAYMVRRRLSRRPFREAEVRGIMRQLLAGVEWSHRAGVLHRDVKPENVLVNDGSGDDTRSPADGQKERKEKKPAGEITYKICDYGMSEPMALPPEKTKREYSPLATTCEYRAPELFLGSTDYDGRIDSWGLGCIMAELLAGAGGRALFDGRGKTGKEVLASMLDTVGARGIKEWPGMCHLAWRHPEEARWVRGFRDDGRLRKMFPARVLSEEGFDVLSGLLDSSPRRRLTAAAALKMPWFTDDRRRRRRGFGACFKSCVTD